MKSFNAIVIAIFVLLAMFGVFVFATFTNSARDQIGDVLIWGSLPRPVVEKLLGHVRDQRDDFGGVVYTFMPEETFVPELVQAIAAGRGPDLVFFPSSSFVKDGDKLASIPYSSLSRRDFQDAFVEAGEVFLRDDGVVALPLTIDPLVMYWNRTLFSNAGIANPPRYWDELTTLAPRLTVRAQNGSITQSAVALGTWDNVAHAKEALLSLMYQLGAPVVTHDSDGIYRANLTLTNAAGLAPAMSAIRYTVDFGDPVKPHYSWNRSQKNSRDAFLAGSVAVYFAPASDLLPLRESNPNLNFDVAPVPASRGAGSGVFAHTLGVAIPRGSLNPPGAATVAVILTLPEQQRFLSDLTKMPSPRRDVELDGSADAYLGVFRASALRSFTFLDPDPARSSTILGDMLEDITSGRATISEAVRDASDELQQLLKQ
jgi:ABC-type glycerol-3-phosphate transport system substrate-binding protein